MLSIELRDEDLERFSGGKNFARRPPGATRAPSPIRGAAARKPSPGRSVVGFSPPHARNVGGVTQSTPAQAGRSVSTSAAAPGCTAEGCP